MELCFQNSKIEIFKYILTISIFEDGDYRNKMTSLKSTNKILEFVKTQENAVTPTLIQKNTKVSYYSVLEAINHLKNLGQFEYFSDGRIILVRYKRGIESGNIQRHTN